METAPCQQRRRIEPAEFLDCAGLVTRSSEDGHWEEGRCRRQFPCSTGEVGERSSHLLESGCSTGLPSSPRPHELKVLWGMMTFIAFDSVRSAAAPAEELLLSAGTTPVEHVDVIFETPRLLAHRVVRSPGCEVIQPAFPESTEPSRHQAVKAEHA